MIPTPRSTSLAATGRQGRNLVALTPVLLSFTVVGVDPRRPEDLLSGSVEVGAVVNPALDALLLRSGGARVTEAQYRFDLSSSSVEGLADVLKAMVPGALVARKDLSKSTPEQHARTRRPGAAGRVRAELEAQKATKAALDLSGIDLESKKGREKARGVVVAVDVRRGHLDLHIHTPLFAEGLDLPDKAAHRLQGAQVLDTARLGVRSALELLEAAGDAGIGTVDASRGAGLADAVRMLDGTVLVTRVPGSPGLCEIVPGSVDGVAAGEAPAAEGLAVAARQHLDGGVAVEDGVVEIAEMALSAPVGRDGLQGYQDLYCSVHLASRKGVVNALAPGMGKTVCVLSAWREAAAGRSDWRGLVTVPAGLREQWRNEAARFFPEAAVHVVVREDDLHPALSASGTRIVVVSHDSVARYLETLTSTEWDEIVCDEAVVLRGESQRAKALWQLRKHARRAAALTGTPDERGASDMARLVSWVRAEEVGVTADETVEDVVRRCGPTVFSLQAKEISGELPDVEVETERLTDKRTVAKVKAAETDLAAALQRLREHQQEGRNREAAQLRVQLPRLLGAVRSAASRGVKQARAVELAGNGRQVLAFTEFPEVAREVLALAGDTVTAGAIVGGQTNLERTAAAAAFVNGDLDLLCVSGTGHRGLNLQVATDVIHLDLPLSAAALVQRTARAVRLGGRRGSLVVHVPYLAGTADERLVETFGPVLEDLQELTQGHRTTVDLYSVEGMSWLLRQ